MSSLFARETPLNGSLMTIHTTTPSLSSLARRDPICDAARPCTGAKTNYWQSWPSSTSSPRSSARGADLNRMIPALSAYIGQVGLGSTDRSLSLTPERFRTQLDKLSPRRGKKRWRENPALIGFLAEL